MVMRPLSKIDMTLRSDLAPAELLQQKVGEQHIKGKKQMNNSWLRAFPAYTGVRAPE